MRKLTRIATAAVMVGGLGLAAQPSARAENKTDHARATPAKAEGAVGTLTFPAGFQKKDLSEVSDVRGELATVTEDALKMDHFNNFIHNFVDGDRDRLGQFKDAKAADLNGKINVIQKFWKDKYGKDFAISKDVFRPEMVAIVTGEVTDSAQAVANWPLDARTGMAVHRDSEAVAAAAHDAAKTFGGKTNLDKGRNVAMVKIAESHGLPSMALSMIHELPDQWRFDIPNDRTGQQVYNDLLNQLNYIATHSSDWPKDANDASAMVAHRVLCAVYGVSPDLDNTHAKS